MSKILVVEDDKDLCMLFSHVLNKNGFETKSVYNGLEALEEIQANYYDMVISDIMMPVMDGYELLKKLREDNNNIPVLMITAKDAFDDMQLGFQLGSDDYMIKPVNINEMILRVNAILRRAQMNKDNKIVIGNTTVEYETMTVNYDGNTVIVPLMEFKLLYKLLSFPGKIYTRQQLMDEIWGYENETETHTVDVHVSRLRDRLRDNNDFKIVTLRGVGYKVVKL